ncbi:MAG: serine/threonine protein kinase [Acidobacteriota bacterium]|nr:serine/threonine protein kinase [Acidobacteriota bacterium]
MLDGERPAAPRAGSHAAARPSDAGASRQTSAQQSFDGARFLPGTVLDGRYRIIALLGRGGMGEVYRADDLKLGQQVALKFLPEALSRDEAALARLYREVRIARQVSHPNVCRVYDEGQTAGQHFLSMEYIRGEELASTLKRFGRLPADKATEIARQICAGLAAAHKTGVLHRDLKPANVMIDDAGSARVTDFGLAAVAEEIKGSDAYSGTPAYMSPEQIAGKELTARSDIYSLGLVLYELFTGKRAFEAPSLVETLRLRQGETQPAAPSSLVKDLDPLVERVILRCLEPDPDKRPASAMQVVAALPGGDPLAVALAMGETPSPEMVAAAPKEGSLRPAVAAALLAAFVVCFGAVLLMTGRVAMHRQLPLDKSPEVLRERAQEIARRFGYNDPPADSWHSLSPYNIDYINYIREHDQSAGRWARLRAGAPPVVVFMYRQSPRYLAPLSQLIVQFNDPPLEVSGMVNVSLDTRGRLALFRAVPPQVDEGQKTDQQPDWSAAFTEAELDMSRFAPAQSRYTPPDAYDARAAWEGVVPEQPDVRVRVEAAGYRGRLTYFEIVPPWERPERQQPFQLTRVMWLQQAVQIGILLLVIVVGVLLARRNLRLGRGDRRGAWRLALFLFAVFFVDWLSVAHHVPTVDEVALFLRGVALSMFWAGIAWLVYVALEPFVRRRWPGLLISWNRLLAGDWRDPLVGRDVLVGAAVGVFAGLVNYCWTLAPKWAGLPPDTPYMTGVPQQLVGIGGLVDALAGILIWSVLLPLVGLFVLLLLSLVLRKMWLAAAGGWLLLGFVIALAGNNPAIDWLFALALSALFGYVLFRHGALTMFFAVFFVILCTAPLTTDPTSWYFANGAVFVFLALALALYGFYTSLAGQPLFKGRLLDE